MWLAVRKKLWTLDRRYNHGLQNQLTVASLVCRTKIRWSISWGSVSSLGMLVYKELGYRYLNRKANGALEDWWLQSTDILQK
jgi:hypothetical protein